MRIYNGHLKLRRTAEVKVRFTPGADHFFLLTTRTISRHCLA
jgi:alpha/beta superfamily hydrolase